jgi:hypothetical protein
MLGDDTIDQDDLLDSRPAATVQMGVLPHAPEVVSPLYSTRNALAAYLNRLAESQQLPTSGS